VYNNKRQFATIATTLLCLQINPMPDLQAVFGTQKPVALVTGAGAPRIGNCVARCLAQRGYRVAIHAHRSLDAAQKTVAELQAGGSDALGLCADLTEEASVRHLVNEARSHFGRLDVLANCAAIWSPKRLENVTADDVRSNFDANTLATFLCCQHVGLAMVEQSHGGAIVNVSDWAIARPYRDYSAYFPSKGAIPALTRSFAVELAARNPRVRVNAVLPGPVMLPPDLPAAERQAAIAGTLAKREGRPQNVAQAIVFLVENDYVTGVCLPVDGGRTIHTHVG
jgi:pteridine reductase